MNYGRVSLIILTVLLAVGLLVPPVFADHNVYLADSNQWQRSEWSLSENYVNRSWFDGQVIYWRADPSWDTVATNAVNAWQAAFPSRSWSKVTLGGDLRIITAPITCSRACWSIKTIHVDSNSQANYTKTAEIHLSTSIPAGQLMNAVLHELGHHLGLDERYHHTSPLCNNSEDTVMDAGGCEDLQQPSSLDVARVSAMYLLTNSPGSDRSANELKSLNASVSGDTMTATWLDGAWGDSYHRIAWYRWNGSAWELRRTQNVGWNVGMRDGWDTRSFSDSYDRSLSGGDPGYYQMCGWASNNSGTHGPTACTASIWVP